MGVEGSGPVGPESVLEGLTGATTGTHGLPGPDREEVVGVLRLEVSSRGVGECVCVWSEIGLSTL